MTEFAPISVVIPVHGHLDCIFRAIESVAVQTMLPVEVILVNDGGGKDAENLLGSICDKYEANWVKLINLPVNQGAAYSRNMGWDQAIGDYIAFLDADDAWHPEKIKNQYIYMMHNPLIDFSGHLHRVETSQPVWKNYAIRDSINPISKSKILLLNPFVTPSVMLKKSVSLRFNGAQRYSEDYRLWIALVFNNYRGVRLNSELGCIYKPSLSRAGLSSHLWKMECGELMSYISLPKFGMRYIPIALILIPYSLVKFLRRIFIFIFLR